MDVNDLISSIEACNFECVAGNLTMCDDWMELKRLVNVWCPTNNPKEIVL